MSDNTEVKMEKDSLYREEMITDRNMGTIRMMTPISSDGATDINRQVLYVGQAQIMTPVGALPVAFDITAGSLDEAISGYSEAAKQAIESTVNELKELQRQQSSSIVMPGGPEGGGVPGGGKIQMP